MRRRELTEPQRRVLTMMDNGFKLKFQNGWAKKFWLKRGRGRHITVQRQTVRALLRTGCLKPLGNHRFALNKACLTERGGICRKSDQTQCR